MDGWVEAWLYSEMDALFSHPLVFVELGLY